MAIKKGTKKTPPRQFGLEAPRGKGRPRTTVADLPENWKQIMMDEAQTGGSNVSLMVVLGIHGHAFNTLIEDDINFRETVGACQLLAQHWHEKRGRDMISGANGNAVVWKFSMQNRFSWKEKTELAGDQDAPVQIETKKKDLNHEELIAELEARGLPTSVLVEQKDE